MKKFGLVLLALFSMAIPLWASVAYAAPTFSDQNIQRTWERADKLLTEQTNVGRGYVYGPDTIFSGQESYAEAPGGKRAVQYFDKARLEVNNPSADRADPNFVTSGLLVKELVLGRQQNGNEVTNYSTGNPSEVQIAGDPNTNNQNQTVPTYRSFRNLATFNGDNPVDPKLGQSVTQRIDKAGNITTITSPDTSVSYTAYESATKHNIANVFVEYGNRQGLVWNGSTYVNAALFFPNATAVFGLPITDPYWVRSVVSGTEKDVLVQLFERRVLTYTPTNDTNNRVEMGNVGQHYYRWRYLENIGLGAGQTPPPTTPATPPPTNQTDFTQFRAPYLKSGGIPQGGSGNVITYPTGASAINSSPVYDPNTKTAYVGTASGGVVAVNINNFNTPVTSWRYQPSGVNFNSAVVLSNGVIYIGAGDGKVYAINQNNGSLLWSSSASGSAVTTKVAVDADSVYFVSGDGKLYAINLSNGTPKWQNQPSGVNLTNSPAIGPDGTIYVAGNDNKLYTFKKDGTQVPGANWSTIAFDGAITGAPGFGNGRIYIGTANGTLYSLNTNGTVQTQKTFTAGKGIYTVPAIVTVNGAARVYVGTDDGSVYGMDANNLNSAPLFTFSVGGSPAAAVRSSIAFVDGFVYFAAENKNVYRVEAANQSASATLATASSTFGTNSAVVNSGIMVIASQDGNLYFVR